MNYDEIEPNVSTPIAFVYVVYKGPCIFYFEMLDRMLLC